MANLIKQKFLEGIDSSKFKIEQGGAIKAVNASGQLVDVFMFDTANEVVKVFGNEEVAVASYVDALMSQEVVDRNAAINSAITDLINGAPQALDTLKELADALGDKGDAIAALVSQLAQETTDRQAADTALDGRLTTAEGEIDTLQSEMDAVELSISNETSARQMADDALDGRLDTAESEIDVLQSEMDAVELGLSNETSARQMADDALDGRLDTAESEINTLQSEMDAVELGLSNETSARQMADDALDGRLDTAESEIDTLQSEMDAVELSVSNETSARQMADDALDARLDVIEGADTVEGSVAKAEKDAKDYADSIMATEQAARQAADSALQAEIDAEEVARAAAVSAEETRALAAEAALQSDIDDLDAYAQEIRADLDQEILDRTADFEAEEARAMAAEAALQAEIDAEETARAAAVTAEETARIAGDANLQSQINNILSNVDPAALDSLTEVVAAFQDADSDLNDAITALGTGSQSALAQEIADRIADVNAEETRALAAEAALQSDIDAEELRASEAEAGLQDSIDAEVIAREADVDAEEARAMAAESVLQGNIDTEQAAREAEDLTFFKHDGSRALSGNMDANDKQINSARSVSFVDLDNQDPSYEYDSRINRDSIFLWQQSLEINPGLGGQSYTSLNANKPNGFGHAIGYTEEQDSEGNIVSYPWSTDVSASAANGGFRVTSYNMDPSINYFMNTNLNMGGVSVQNYNENVWSITNFDSNGFPTGDVLFSSANKKMTISADNNELVLKSLDVTTGVKIIGNSIKAYSGSVDANGDHITFEPTVAQDLTTKYYVDSHIEYAKTFAKETIEIDSSSELSSVTLSGPTPVPNSLVVFVNRLALHEGIDYSVMAGVITWMGDFAVGGSEAIEEGDVINVTYMYQLSF